MSKKKSYMNNNNILSEGFFDYIKKLLTQYPALKKDKEFQNNMKDLNSRLANIEKIANQRIKKAGLKKPKYKIKKFKTSDFM